MVVREMSEPFSIELWADHPHLAFDLKYFGRTYVVRLHGGEWQLVFNGGVKANLAQGRVHWCEVLKRAVDYLEGGQ